MEIIHISQERLCSFCKNAGSCSHLTHIYTNTLLYIYELELPTNRAVGSTMPADSTTNRAVGSTIPADSTPFTISSNLAYDVLCVGQHMGPVFLISHFLTSPTIYHFRSSSRHFTLTSLQTYIIVKSQHTLTTTSLQDPTN